MSIGVLCLGLFAVSPIAARAATTPVVVIVMENEQYSSIVGNANAPFINNTMIPGGVLETSYTAVQSGSKANYLAMTSGTTSGGSVPNVFGTLGTATPWKELEESMPSACFKGSNGGVLVPGSTTDYLYTKSHNAAIWYNNVSSTNLCNNTVPLDTGFDPNSLPAFSYVVPNECNDMHSNATSACPMWNASTNPVPTSLSNAQRRIAMGDYWLSKFVPAVASKATIILTWDESNGSPSPPEHIVTLEYGLGVSHTAIPNGQDGTSYNHYGLEAGLYGYFGLGAAPSGGATATPLPVGYGTPPAPTISSILPGYVGQQVTITGTNLTGATFVKFGALAAQFTVNSDTNITASVPCATSGTIGVTVTTSGGTSTPSSFTPSALPTPSVTGFTPALGPVGTSVTITGLALGCAIGVSFNTTAATTFSSTSDTQMTATIPSGATGSGPIRVTNATGTGTSSNNFMVTTAPAITRVGLIGTSPSTGGTNTLSVTVGPSGVAAGDTVVLGIVAQGTPSVTIQDSEGNSYAVNVNNPYSGTGKCLADLASSKLSTALASGDTISVAVSSGLAWGFVAEDWEGLSALDQQNKADSNSITGTAVSAATLSTTAANEAVFGLVCVAGSNTITVGAGYSTMEPNGVKFLYSGTARMLGLESKIVSSIGAQNATFTLGSSANWAADVGTYK